MMRFAGLSRLEGVTSKAQDLLPIGEVAERSGVAASALRFYESLGLLRSQWPSSGRRL